MTSPPSPTAMARTPALSNNRECVPPPGGISEIHKIAWRAHDRGIRLIPHGWNTAVGLAADLQLAAALPDTDRVEYVTGSPYVDDLAGDRWHLDEEGTLEIPNDPGLGIELDADALATLADNPKLLPSYSRHNRTGCICRVPRLSQASAHDQTDSEARCTRERATAKRRLQLRPTRASTFTPTRRGTWL